MIFVWTIWDALALLVVVYAILMYAVIEGRRGFRQWKCKHDGGVNETGTCNAICRKCGKNIGFIGAWRKR